MTRQSPWSVKGISPKTREAAKDFARREGMPIGEWLSGLISEVDLNKAEANPPADVQPASHTYAQPVYDPTYAASAAPRLQPFPPSQQQPSPAPTSPEQSRLVEVLESLTRRLDPLVASPAGYAGPVPAAAIHTGPSHVALERALTELATHVESRDRHNSRTLGQIDAGLGEIQQTQEALAERLRRMEQNNSEHRSVAALRSLEVALAQLDRDMRALQARVGDDAAGTGRMEALEKAQRETIARFDSVQEALQGSVSSLAAASGNLAERILDLETATEGSDSGMAARFGQLENITTRALEEADRGLGLLNERIASTEAMAQETNQRFAEVMIDLSARLAALEGQDAVVDLSGVMAEIAKVDTKVAALDSRMSEEIQSSRDALRAEVVAGLTEGIDARFAEMASALSGRLDTAEQTSAATMERIGSEIARIAEALDHRVSTLESDEGRGGSAIAMKLEVARISRAIDDRLSQIEERSVGLPEATNRQIEALGASIETRLDSIEQRSVEAARAAAGTSSEEMRELVRRLEARQTEMADTITRRVSESEERAERRMDDRFRAVERDIQAAEDRAKAVAAPLHRGFETLLDRIDSIESSDTAGFAETVPAPDYRMSFSAAEPVAESAPARRSGFATPFPGDPADPLAELSQPFDAAAANAFGAQAGDSFGFDALAGDPNSALPELHAIDDDDIEVWPMDEPIGAPTGAAGGRDYIANARRAAIQAAQADAAQSQNAKAARPKKQRPTAKPTDAKAKTQAGPTAQKQGLSPVGMVAAAGLVLTVGAVGYNYLAKQSATEEMPEALTSKAAAPAIAPAAVPEVVPPSESIPAGPATMPADPVAASSSLEGSQTGGVPAPAATAIPPQQQLRPGSPSPQLERLAREEQARADAARSRATQRPAATRPQPAAPRAATAPASREGSNPREAGRPTPASAGTPRIASAATARPPQAAAARPGAAALLAQARQRRQSGDAAGAAALMQQAADGGSVAAQNELASMYERGEGVQRDLAQARRWTERAAASGSRRAQHNLGVYYTEGEGAQRDYNRARESFAAAARRGNTDSQFNLGAMAEQGLGTEASQADAAFWYTVAGRGGDQEAARQAARVRAALPPEQQAQVDARAAAFQPEPAAEE
jgi:localization factor PodJL